MARVKKNKRLRNQSGNNILKNTSEDAHPVPATRIAGTAANTAKPSTASRPNDPAVTAPSYARSPFLPEDKLVGTCSSTTLGWENVVCCCSTSAMVTGASGFWLLNAGMLTRGTFEAASTRSTSLRGVRWWGTGCRKEMERSAWFSLKCTTYAGMFWSLGLFPSLHGGKGKKEPLNLSSPMLACWGIFGKSDNHAYDHTG